MAKDPETSLSIYMVKSGQTAQLYYLSVTAPVVNCTQVFSGGQTYPLVATKLGSNVRLSALLLVPKVVAAMRTDSSGLVRTNMPPLATTEVG